LVRGNTELILGRFVREFCLSGGKAQNPRGLCCRYYGAGEITVNGWVLISALGATQGLLLGALLASKPYNRQPANRWLAAFILTMSIVSLSVHEGSAGTFDALAVIQPDQNRAVIVLGNAYSAEISATVTQTGFDLLDPK